ncbi:MAG: transporter, partial [Rhodanobacter sp. SCN 67-45]
ARAAAITAGARPNPTISGSAEYNTDAAPGASPWARGLGLSVPIETAGKRRQRIAQAVALTDAARFELVDMAWQVRGRVRAELLGIASTEALLRRQQALEAERVRLMQRRIELGFAAQPDLTSARIALQQITVAVDEAHKQQAEHRAALAGALGLPVAALDSMTPELSAFERVPTLDALPSSQAQRQALLQRPDLQAALARYRASDAGLRLEFARQYPDLTLSPGLLWDAGQAKWSLGLSLVLPLLNRNQGRIAEAKARREQAAANVLAVQAKAIGQAEQAQASVRAALDKLRNAEALVASQQRKVQSARRLQRAGESERSTTLGAQVELAAAEVTRQATQVQVQQALGALEDAQRRPLDGGAFAPLPAIETTPRAQQDIAR